MPKDERPILKVPINRIEGDLELLVEHDGNTARNAWSKGIMFRGFENLLKGRGPLDGLVLTPRVCGICGTAHLMAAVKALEMLCEATLPENAAAVRNLALLAEHVQSDIRHGILMFMKDFLNPLYEHKPFFQEAGLRYEPFHGTSVLEAIRETKKILEIPAIVGGQWPNSSFMVPGGIATNPSFNDIIGCNYILKDFTRWYEQRILGCAIDRWSAVSSRADLENWLTESEAHRNGDLGFFIHCALSAGLDKIGAGHGNFISFGFPEEENDFIASSKSPKNSGFLSNGNRIEFNQARISEHIAFSRFEGYGSGLHPFEGMTKPVSPDADLDKYSWVKAPRYDDMPAETGPLAERLIGRDPLFSDLVDNGGTNAFCRELARLTRPAKLLPLMAELIARIDTKAPYYFPVKDIPDGRGYGLIQAARGALGHWIEVRDGVIGRYQIITPTAWNGSPRDANGIRGPWEQAMIGTALKDTENPVELGHIVRSFDACLVCAVHMCKNNRA